MTAYVEAVTTAVPPFELTQERVIDLAREVLHGKVPFVDQALGLFENSGVDTRHLVRDVDELLGQRSLKWRNDVYIEECRRLGIELMEDLFERTGTEPGEIDTALLPDVSIITVGTNYYVSKHQLKWTTDVGVGLEPVPTNRGTGVGWREDTGTPSPADGQFVFRTQLQLLF